jgi:hypothetical protein
MYRHLVLEDANSSHLGELDFEREIQRDECVAYGASVYRVRSMRILGPSSNNRRELRVAETNDAEYVARLA